VFAYHEDLERGLTRLTDQAWQASIEGGHRPADVPWLAPVLAPR
jgi:hypothetical protein